MADYPGAIDFPAHPTNTLGPPCTPKGWVLHTPEEPADGYPGTPHWFAQYHANPDQRGSTHYFVSYLGFVFQCVDESVAPIANGVLGKPYPNWANPNQSLNRQSLSVEIEGYAATIRNTISPAQKTALVNLLAYGCDKYAFPRDRAHIIGHYQVATNRTDPGTLDIDALVAELQEDDMGATPEEAAELKALRASLTTLTEQFEKYKVDVNANIAQPFETLVGQVEKYKVDVNEHIAQPLDAHLKSPHQGGTHSHEGTVKVE